MKRIPVLTTWRPGYGNRIEYKLECGHTVWGPWRVTVPAKLECKECDGQPDL